MADEENPEENEPEEGAEAEGEGQDGEEKKSKGPIKLIGGVVIVMALGIVAAMMAVPKKEVLPRFKGVFHYSVFEEKFSANLRDNNQTRFLQMTLDCEYVAYEEAYLAARVGDPLYDPRLRDAVGRVISDKYLADTYEGPAREAFLEELRVVLDPILFPVHIGATAFPLELDAESGLRPGISYTKSGFRGRFFEHVLKVDPAGQTLQIDEGEAVPFNGDEEDLKVPTPSGEVVYVDVTALNPEFAGEVNVGVQGRLRRLYAKDLIAQ